MSVWLNQKVMGFKVSTLKSCFASAKNAGPRFDARGMEFEESDQFGISILKKKPRQQRNLDELMINSHTRGQEVQLQEKLFLGVS